MERRAATACHCMLSCATAYYVFTHLRILDNGGTAIHTDKRKKSVAAQSVRALRLLRAMRSSRYLYAHMHNLGVYFFLARFLSLFLPSSPPARRDGSWRLVQIRVRTALLASNALAVGVKYTHLHTLGVW